MTGTLSPRHWTRPAAVSGVAPERIYVDKGYRGHDYAGAGRVMIAGSRRGLIATMRRELKRRSAIEATIGHMKTDGRLDRNFLLGRAGDAINALLAAAGHNLRLVLAALALWLAFFLAAIARATAKSDILPNRLNPKTSMPQPLFRADHLVFQHNRR
jgi:transposase, IS5 family